MISLCALAVVVVFTAAAEGHPSRNGKHVHVTKEATIIKLKNNIHKMERLLDKQELRLEVGFSHLKDKVESMMKMADRAETELYQNLLNERGNCTLLPTPPNGRIIGLDSVTNEVPEELYFACDDGYHLHGSELRRCSENGTWTGQDVICVDITSRLVACAKLNCKNGGICTHVDENESYMCRCLDGFYGRRCQKKRRKSTGDDGLMRASCVYDEGKITCSCLPGYKIGPNHNLCFDINECADQEQPVIDVIPDDVGSIAKRHTASRRSSCRHQCVNTVGSYKCTCPAGYIVDPNDLSTCHDVDECEEGLHNCTGNEQCFNTGGEFQCVQVICPPNYFKSSPFVCQRESCNLRDRACLSDPYTYAHTYIDLPVNLDYPTAVFRLIADEGSSVNINRFSVLPGNSSDYFKSRKDGPLAGMLVLLRAFDSSAPVTVDYEMREMTSGRKRHLVARFVNRVTFFVSPSYVF